MSETPRMALTRARCSGSLASSSSRSQSTVDPSETEAANSCRCRSMPAMRHLPRKANEGAGDRHSRRVGGSLSEDSSQLLVAESELDPGQDRLAVFGLQLLQGSFIALERLAAD